MFERLKRAAAAPLAILILAYDALDAAFGPLVRPMLAWLASLDVFRRIGRWIASLPAYAVLALLAVPFAVIEPFKFVALYWLAQGRVALGLTALVAAHLASILICERIFHVGKARLLTIGWFAKLYGLISRIRDAALAWLRATPAWRVCAKAAVESRNRLRRMFRRSRFRSRSRRPRRPAPAAPPPRSSDDA